MINDSKIEYAEFEHFERVSDSRDLKSVRNFIENPDLEDNKREIANIFARMNVEVNADDLAKAMKRHSFSD